MTKLYAWFGEFALLGTIPSIIRAITLLLENVYGEHSCCLCWHQLGYNHHSGHPILKNKIWLDALPWFVVGTTSCNVFAPDSSSIINIYLYWANLLLSEVLSHRIASRNSYFAYSHAFGTEVALCFYHQRNIYMYRCFVQFQPVYRLAICHILSYLKHHKQHDSWLQNIQSSANLPEIFSSGSVTIKLFHWYFLEAMFETGMKLHCF